MTQTSESARAIAEVGSAVASVSPDTLDRAARMIADAGKVAAYAGGREGLVMKGLVMRLFHAGVDAHAVGEMTVPHLGEGDLVILSCGPGRISMVTAIADTARRAGAKILYVTAEPDAEPADRADEVLVIDAQTMARDSGSDAVLPMGSAYEIGMFVLVDLITRRVRDLRGDDAEAMRARHTNLE
ncbi:6-phospho-3-hexuloisomerase [Microbacterium sp. JB110]|uniref:6-phospho-3-hexuloisomerase n=1 Tax=unclassified Microbacterium TaxID=2609290 RepID=UPI000DF19FAA|nr:6-phospho-3-hexuloisomerase [Microbacterium sp. JB110]RCS58776.1 6-phospho-3-hexuloisomerase [Microbacterium sp. JB110]